MESNKSSIATESHFMCSGRSGLLLQVVVSKIKFNLGSKLILEEVSEAEAEAEVSEAEAEAIEAVAVSDMTPACCVPLGESIHHIRDTNGLATMSVFS